MKKVQTLQDLLFRASSFSRDHGVGFIDNQGQTKFISYQQLYETAGRGAYILQQQGLQSGEYAIIALDSNEDCIIAFWSCLFGGIIPTILQAPAIYNTTNQAAQKISNVCRVLGKPHLFIQQEDEGLKDTSFDAQIHFWDVFKKQLAASFNTIHQKATADQTAYIQFSSGSTGQPKGVVLSHQNITSNIEAISIGLKFHPYKPTVNWMPLYHDMGLIGYHLTTTHACTPQYHIQTIDFIRNPYLWLDALSEKKAGITGCPNFGLVLTNRYLKKRPPNKNWDFTALEGLLNGAEPISARVMYEFNELLAPYNFSPKAMMPVYGMAEATLAVSFTEYYGERKQYFFNRNRIIRDKYAEIVDAEHIDAQEIVAVGKNLKNISYRIVDSSDHPVEERNIGHIQIYGNSITQGYYSKEANKNIFTQDGWLRTGDMGFHYDNQLFITGRYKDIIFFGGRNLYAHDFEYVALEIEGLQYGKVIFCGLFDEKLGQDKVLCFLAGISPSKREDTETQLKTLITDRMGVGIHEIIWIKPVQIPKTSSGKLQRYKLLEAYLKEELS